MKRDSLRSDRVWLGVVHHATQPLWRNPRCKFSLRAADCPLRPRHRPMNRQVLGKSVPKVFVIFNGSRFATILMELHEIIGKSAIPTGRQSAGSAAAIIKVAQ